MKCSRTCLAPDGLRGPGWAPRPTRRCRAGLPPTGTQSAREPPPTPPCRLVLWSLRIANPTQVRVRRAEGSLEDKQARAGMKLVTEGWPNRREDESEPEKVFSSVPQSRRLGAAPARFATESQITIHYFNPTSEEKVHDASTKGCL
ncbi:hypothetical protein BJY00DRAFT_71543 [Aspergillus carlsbadensis]|nr:hypothetical protein BJY00DRAFT_71543 [Aspergillus carlsbadensis]